MRRLGPRRHRAGRPLAWTCCAVADREDRWVARRLQCRCDHELVDAIGLQAVELLQHLRCLDACRPYNELAGNERAISEPDAFPRHLRNLGTGADLNAHLTKQAERLP